MRAGHGERDLGNPNTAPPTPELHGINPVFLSSNPSRWSVEEVYEFIASLQGTNRTQVTCTQFSLGLCTALGNREHNWIVSSRSLKGPLSKNKSFSLILREERNIDFTYAFIGWLWVLERRETWICCSTYLCVHWLTLVHVFTGDWTSILHVLGQSSNQLNYPAQSLYSRYFFLICPQPNLLISSWVATLCCQQLVFDFYLLWFSYISYNFWIKYIFMWLWYPPLIKTFQWRRGLENKGMLLPHILQSKNVYELLHKGIVFSRKENHTFLLFVWTLCS